MCLTPRCNCLYRRSREEFRTASISVLVAGRPKQCRVPEWVAYSLLQPEDAKEQAQLSCLDVPLRYDVIPVPRQRPEWQGLKMFRHHFVQCQTTRLVPLTHEAVQTALAAAMDFLQSLITCYDEYWGSVGVAANLTDLYSQMSTCWSFTEMMQGKKHPTEASYDALLRLMDRFRPKLATFHWPDAKDFPYVSRSWPERKELRRQFLVLWTIIRRRFPQHEDWLHLKTCKVSLVQPHRFLVHMLHHLLHGAASGDMLVCLSDLVWRFVSGS